MKRLVLVLALLAGIFLPATAHAQTCATSTAIGWHDCGSAAHIVSAPNPTPAQSLCVGGYQCLNNGGGVFAYSGAVVDSSRNRMVVFGGGHTNYSGNEQYAITFDPAGATPTASLLVPTTNPSACSMPSCDGGVSPNSRHTYGNMVYMPNYDALFIFGGSIANLGYSINDAWMYHYQSNWTGDRWEYLDPISTCPRCTSSGAQKPTAVFNAGVFFNVDDGRVYVWDGTGGIWSYDYSHKAWDSLVGQYEGGFQFGCSYSNVGIYDKSRKRLWISNGSCGMMYLDITSYMATGTLTTNVLIANSNAGTGSYGGMAYDPVSTNIVMWNGGINVLTYNPTTNAFSTDSSHGGALPADSINGPFGRWSYSPGIDAFVLDNLDSGFNETVWVYRSRSSSGDVTPPTNPSSLTATPASSSQINLSWTASTDLVGVTNYFIERCSGAACSNFAQVNAAAATSFADVGLTLSTSYSYRVRATDAAGNLSGYSNTATATTTGSGDVTAPTNPSALTVNITSYRQASLAWTGSTDNVAVTSYLVERCLGVSCSSFALANTVLFPTTTYVEFNLANGSAYSWRVRATDASGNLSGYSNTVSGSTPSSTIMQVGNGKQFTTTAAAIAVAPNGANIEIDHGGIFNQGSVSLRINNICLTISGVGPPGTYAQFLWDGGSYNNGTGGNPLPNDKGILYISPGPCGVTLNNIELAGAYGPSGNDAGIRCDETGPLTLNNVYIHDNQEGVLCGAPGGNVPMVVTNSIFARNGDESGQTHNFYVGELSHLTFTYNKSVQARGGHDLKSRAFINEIYSNFLGSKDSTYDDGIEIDLPNGGTNYIIGNVIEQGTNTSNSSIIAIGEETLGTTCPGPQCWNPTNLNYVINNTVANYRSSGVFLQVTSTGGLNTPSPFVFVNQNNIFYHGGTLYNRASPTLESNNNTTATVADFVNGDAGNYRLVMGAAEVNAGIDPGSANGVSLVPTTVYMEPANSAPRLAVGVLDIGAYEFGNAVPTNTASRLRIH